MTAQRNAKIITSMNTWRSILSPRALAGPGLWVVVMVAMTQWAIPVFANVGSGPQCLPTPCAAQTTTEWLPSLAAAAVAATLVVAMAWGLLTLIRRPRVASCGGCRRSGAAAILRPIAAAASVAFFTPGHPPPPARGR